MGNQILDIIDLDITFDGIILYQNTEIIHTNKAFTDIFGYEKEEVVGKNIIPILFHEDDIKSIKKKVHDNNEFVYQAKAITKDGENIIVELKGKTFTKNGKEYRIKLIRDITESVENQKKLVEQVNESTKNAKYFRSLIQTIQDGFWILNKQGKMCDVNEAYLRMSGYSRDEFLQLNINDIDAIENPVETKNRIERIINNGSELFETKHKRKDGTEFYAEISTTYFPDGGGQFVCICRDITEKKQYEQKIITAKEKAEESESKYNFVSSNTSDSIWALDANLKFTYLSLATEKLFGYSIKEWETLNWNEFVNPEYMQTVLNTFEKLKSGKDKNPFPISVMVKHKNGTDMWVEFSLNGIYDENNVFSSAVGITRDITERKNAEYSRQLNEAKFRNAFEHSAIGMALISPEGKWIKINKRVSDIVGYSQNELLGMTFQDITHPDDLEKDLYFVRQMLAGEIQTYQIEKRYFHKDGHIVWALLAVSLVWDENNEPLHFISQIEDITNRKEAIQSLEKSEERLKLIINKNPFPITIADTNDEKIIYWSESARELTGYSPKTVSEWYELAYPDKNYREQVKKRYESILDQVKESKSAINTGEYQIQCKDGSTKIVEIYSQFIPGNLVVTINDITNRKDAELELLKAKNTIEEQKIFLTETQKAGKIGSIKAHFIKDTWQSSKSLDEIFGIDKYYKKTVESWAGLIHPEDRSRMINYIQNDFINEKKEFDSEYRIIRNSDKKTIWVHGFGNPIFDNKNNVVGVYGTIQDITKRKKVEEDLIQQHQFMKKLNNSLESVVFIVNIEKREIEYVNKRVAAIFGYTTDECIGNETSFLYPSKSAFVDYGKQMQKAIQNKMEFLRIENILKRKNGELFETEITTTFLSNKRVVAVISDISERKKAEKELKKSQRDLQELVMNAPVCIKKVDLDFNLQFMSKPGISQLKIDNINELYCKPYPLHFFPEKFKQEMSAKMKEVKQIGKTLSIEGELADSLGNKLFYRHIIVPVKDESDKLEYLLVVSMDINDRKKSEALLARSSKLESIGTLAGGIAHDFNNLLSGIYGNVELARFKSKEENVLNHLDGTLESLERATSLTNQLLTFSKGGAPNKKEEEIGDLIEKTTKFALSGSKVGCNVNIMDGLYYCSIDKNQIMQVIDNLIINAKQAMPSGGTIGVSVSNTIIDDGNILNLDTGKYVKIEIEDTGVGISEENLPKIFDPFFTTKLTGHGIGLSTAYSIILRHDGVIDAESIFGEGTKFTIYLPASDSYTEKQEIKENLGHSGKGTFLVMDDEESVLNVVGGMLEVIGYDVVKKKNGEEVLEYFKSELSEGREVAGMLFDLTIPGAMGGQETIIEIRKLCKKTKVFVASGYTDSEIMARPTDFGFNGTLKKPFGLQEIIELFNKQMS